MCLHCDFDEASNPTEESLKLSNYCDTCRRIFKNFIPAIYPKVFGYIHGNNFKLIKSLQPFQQVHFLFRFMKIILSLEDSVPADLHFELILNSISDNVFRVENIHDRVQCLSFLTNHIFALIDSNVDFNDDMSALTVQTGFDSVLLTSSPPVKNTQSSVESEALSIVSTLQRIESRLKTIEALNLGDRLRALESSLKKPKDVTPYDDDDSDDS